MDIWVEEYTDVNVLVPLFATSPISVIFHKGQDSINMAQEVLNGVSVTVNYDEDTYHINGAQNTGFALNLTFINVTNSDSGKYSVDFLSQQYSGLDPFLETNMDFELYIWSKC